MKESPMFNKERQQKILEMMKQNGSVSVNTLAELFHVTPATIRVDLSRLEAEGELIRTHGGAIANIPNHRELRLHERLNQDKKIRIASKAAELVREHDIVLVDTGTTTVSFANALVGSSRKELTVYTNDIDVIRILEEKESFSLHLLAGKVRNGFHYCCGPEISQTLEDCHFSKLFLTASAISMDHGLTVTNPELAQLKRDMIRASEQVILLADSSKLHHVDFQKFAELEQVDVLVIDSELSEEDRAELESAVKQVVLA